MLATTGKQLFAKKLLELRSANTARMAAVIAATGIIFQTGYFSTTIEVIYAAAPVGDIGIVGVASAFDDAHVYVAGNIG